jgi:hypothetical protein
MNTIKRDICLNIHSSQWPSSPWQMCFAGHCDEIKKEVIIIHKRLILKQSLESQETVTDVM